MNVRPRTNWAGNVAFAAPGFYCPSSLSELQALVAQAGPRHRIRVLGTGHSFNDLADSPGTQVTLAGLPPEVSVDSAARLARGAAGLSYAELAGRLDEAGFALRNLASLPHISVAGATATATHGSGAANQNLAADVSGLRLVTAAGDVVDLGRGDDGFEGAVVHLGALGAVVSLTVGLVPSFDVSQRVYENLPLEVLDDRFTDVMTSAYSVSLFTDWRAPRLTQVWIKQRLDVPAPLIQEASDQGFARRARTCPATATRRQCGRVAGRLHRSALRRAGPVVRPAAALPGRVQAQRRRRAPVGVPAPRGARRPRPARPGPDPGSTGSGPADLRDPRGRRRPALAQPVLPPGQRGVPLHLDPRRCRGAARGHAR